jgi:hypothetical protein
MLAIGLLNSVLFLVLLNLVLYAFMRHRLPVDTAAEPVSIMPGSLEKTHPGWREEDLKILLTETVQPKYVYEPFTAFKDGAFHSRFINIDPAGFRVIKDQPPWPPRPEAFKVFVFGGSTAFGFGVADDESIPSYLQECARSSDPSRPIAVYNFGRNGYFSSQERILFQQVLAAGLVPQVAVFIDGLNEFWRADGVPLGTDKFRRFMEGKSGPSPLEKLPMVQTWHWLSARWAKPQPHKSVDYSDPAHLQAILAGWLANKRMIELVASGFGVRPIFVWQPVPAYKYDLRYHFLYRSGAEQGSSNRKLWQAGYSSMENMRSQGKLGANVLWLADMQQDKHENLYVDHWHYTAPFSREIAGKICAALSDTGANPPAKTVAVAIH